MLKILHISKKVVLLQVKIHNYETRDKDIDVCGLVGLRAVDVCRVCQVGGKTSARSSGGV